MDHSKATTKRDQLQTELNEINRLQSSNTSLHILPKLVHQEIQRLSDDVRIPVEGESMLSNVPAEFGLTSAGETQKFKQKLNSELQELQKSTTVPIHFTTEFIQKVIDHTEAYMKKQWLHECAIFGPTPTKDDQTVKMDYDVAIQKIDMLNSDLKKIRSYATERGFNPSLLLKLADAELQRLIAATEFMKQYSDKIRIPAEEVIMLSCVPAEYGLSSAEETEKFIQRLRSENGWLMSFPEKFPITFYFIQRVIEYAERYMAEKRPFERAVFGRTTDDDD